MLAAERGFGAASPGCVHLVGGLRSPTPAFLMRRSQPGPPRMESSVPVAIASNWRSIDPVAPQIVSPGTSKKLSARGAAPCQVQISSATRRRSTVQQATPGRLPRPRRARDMYLRRGLADRNVGVDRGAGSDGDEAVESTDRHHRRRVERNLLLGFHATPCSRDRGRCRRGDHPKEISWAWWRIVGDRRVKRTCGPSCVS